jgi:uncharacterized protein (TIGR03067 family)
MLPNSLCVLAAALLVGANQPPANVDGTWKVETLHITDGKKSLHVTAGDARLVIKDGTGTWSASGSRGTVKADLSQSPWHIDLTYTEGPEKGQVWQGVCSRCGHALAVCVSPGGRPGGFTGSPSAPVTVFYYRLEDK